MTVSKLWSKFSLFWRSEFSYTHVDASPLAGRSSADSALCSGMAPQVKFDMAFTHRVSTDSFSPGNPIWFLIDSVVKEHAETCPNNQVECVVELEKSLKRHLEPDTPPANNKRKKKSVRFEPPAITSPPKTCLSLITTSPIILVSRIWSIYSPSRNPKTP